MIQTIILALRLALHDAEINYACQDQNIDAVFKTEEEAYRYAEYYKPHHNYQVIPFINFYGKKKM